MKKARYLIVVAVLVLLSVLAGCTKTWSVTFNQFTNLDAWAKQDWVSPYTIDLYANGLFLNGKILIGPYGFDGDFTLTYTFEIVCGPGNTVRIIYFSFGDGQYAPQSNYLNIYFEYVGDISLETYDIRRTGGAILLSGSTIPFINRTGLNTLVIVKSGNVFDFKLNGSTLYSSTITSLNFDYFFPYILAVAESTQIRIKSISYKYTGNMIPRP